MINQPRAGHGPHRSLTIRRSSPVVLFFLLPLSLYGQSDDARAAFKRLSGSLQEAGFQAAYAAESARLSLVDDAVWLAGALSSASTTPAQKKALLVEKASLLELAGRYTEAATAWETASTATPGIADADCILSAAACRLLAGDTDSAAGLAKAVAFSSPDPVTNKLASIITGWVALAKGDSQAAATIAASMTGDPKPGVAMPALVLAVAASDGEARTGFQNTLASYKTRPEPGSALPLLLMADPTSITRTAATQPASAQPPVTQASTTKPAIAQPAAAQPAAAQPAAAQPAAAQGGSYFQVGAFRDPANARALLARLEALGLAAISRTRSPGDFTLVYVEAGPDPAKTVMVLKNAGYEAWAVELVP